MAKIIKNLTSTEKIYSGFTLEADSVLTILDEHLASLQSSESLINDLTLQTPEVALMSDLDPTELTGAQAINFLMDQTEKDSDGALLSRVKYTRTGWQFHKMGVEFTTSKLGSIVNTDDQGNNLGFGVIKLYDTNGVEITDQANEGNAVKTIVDIEPTFDYEIMGGSLKQISRPTMPVYAYVIAVPDVPKVLGGQKDFICCLNLEFIGDLDSVDADGRTAKLLQYDATYHTNKIRVVMNHNAGYQHRAMMVLELFKE